MSGIINMGMACPMCQETREFIEITALRLGEVVHGLRCPKCDYHTDFYPEMKEARSQLRREKWEPGK